MSAANESALAADHSPAPSATPTPRAPDTIIYPKSSGVTSAGSTADDPPSFSWMPLFALLLAAAGGWVLWQRKQGMSLLDQGNRKLRVEETRSLGGRQYLVVANYDGKRFLLGVTQGQIQLLSNLPDGQPAPDSKPATPRSPKLP